jgi:hypothetical protein
VRDPEPKRPPKRAEVFVALPTTKAEEGSESVNCPMETEAVSPDTFTKLSVTEIAEAVMEDPELELKFNTEPFANTRETAETDAVV